MESFTYIEIEYFILNTNRCPSTTFARRKSDSRLTNWLNLYRDSLATNLERQLKIFCFSILVFVQKRDATRHKIALLIQLFSHRSELRAPAAYVIVEVYKYLFIDIYIYRDHILYILLIIYYFSWRIMFSFPPEGYKIENIKWTL